MKIDSTIARLTLFAALLGVAAALPAHAAVAISSKPTRNMNCAAGVCTPTAKNAVLNTGDLQGMLASGDVKVTTGAGAVSIGVTAPLTWASSSHLTLDAAYNVSIRSPVVIEGTAGLTIVTDDGGSGGDLLFFDQGKIDFWDTASSLVINGNNYTLAADFITLVNAINVAPSGFYALTSDTDAQVSLTYSPVKTFSGVMEGLGNTISSVTLNNKHSSQSLGIFGTSAGTIRDLHLAQVTVIGPRGAVIGGLVGTASGPLIGDLIDGSISGNAAQAVGGLAGSSSSLIERCDASGHVASVSSFDTADVGGVVGQSTGQISDTTSSATVSGGIVGGIAGSANGPVSNSHATGASGDSQSGAAGGVVGLLGGNGTVTNSSASGAVTSSFGPAGGLVASNSGVVASSFATGAVYARWTQSSGSTVAGGLVGSNVGTLTNVFALGDAKADIGAAGGLIGENFGTSTASYSTGAPFVAQASGAEIGGYVGNDMGMVTHGFWDLDTSGISSRAQGAGSRKNDPGVKGLTDSDLKAALAEGL